MSSRNKVRKTVAERICGVIGHRLRAATFGEKGSFGAKVPVADGLKFDIDGLQVCSRCRTFRWRVKEEDQAGSVAVALAITREQCLVEGHDLVEFERPDWAEAIEIARQSTVVVFRDDQVRWIKRCRRCMVVLVDIADEVD